MIPVKAWIGILVAVALVAFFTGYFTSSNSIDVLREEISNLGKLTSSLEQNLALKEEVERLSSQIEKRAYIYTFGKRTVSIIDPLSKELLLRNHVPYSAWPGNHYIDNNGYLWAIDMEETTNILVIDPKTLGIVKKIETDGTLKPLEVSPDGKIAVAPVASQDELWIIDTDTYSVLKKIKVGKFPCDIDFSKDGKYVYAPNRDSDTVSVIDLSTFEEISRIRLEEGGAPFMLTTSKDGRFILVENVGLRSDGTDAGAGKSLAVIDSLTNKVIKRIELKGRPGVDEPSSDGKYAYVSILDQSLVQVISLSNLEVTEEIKVGNKPMALVVEDDLVYVPNNTDGTLTVIDSSTNSVIKTMEVGESPYAVVALSI